MCMYERMIIDNLAKFKGDEKVMKQSVRLVSDLLGKMKEHHPELYWDFMRDHHEILFGKHFDKEYAKWEVEQMQHKSPDGKVYKGEHWSMEQTTEVMQGYKSKLNADITPCDFYVALNAEWHDYICWAKEHFPVEADAESAIIEMAVRFWFLDDDWAEPTKVWCYFRTKNK